MPKRDDVIGHARDLHGQARWDDACLELLAADAEHELGVEDLELLGEAAQLTGRHDEAVSALEWAFELRAAATDLAAAATVAFWLYSEFLYASEFARAGGWRNLTEGNGVLVAGLAYRRATSLAASVQPGLALLRLRQGNASTAAHGLHRAVAEATRAPARGRLPPAVVTVALAADDAAEAKQALTELERLTQILSSSALDAEYARAQGEVALAAGRPEAALPHLRRGADTWRRLSAPYETARTGMLIGRACRALGDEEGAQLELESARELFAELGAIPELRDIESLLESVGPAPGGLSEREIEVLRLVAAGMTNHAIATQLYISERTVHRHVSNIFAKIGVNSRTAAAAYAVQCGLLP